MPDDRPLHFSSIADVARLIKERELSPVWLTQMMLRRIESVDCTLKSFATVTSERALEAARTAEKEVAGKLYRGPLHGVPVAVKDLCYTRRTRTMAGLHVLRDFVPQYDATVVARLEAAGAVLLGKLNLTEGALLAYCRGFDIPVNPWGAEYWAGVSSSGSGVATAAGLCFGAIGSDTGGSIRLPAAANAVVGLKPTYGRVSRYGVWPLAESLDHIGPMARTVEDAAIMFEAIAGPDSRDPTTLPDGVPDMLAALDGDLAGVRLGVDRRFVFENDNTELAAAIEQALAELQALGATIVDTQMLLPDPAELGRLWLTLCAREAYQAHASHFPSHSEDYGPYIRRTLELGAAISEEDFARARIDCMQFRRRFCDLLSTVDAAVCPSGDLTPAIAGLDQRGDFRTLAPIVSAAGFRFTLPANLAGTPTLSLPCGFSRAGIPLSMQLMGSPLSEPLLCRIGHAYQSATDWHTRHPPV